MEPRPVSHSHAVLVHWLGPTDLNSAGFVHGGVIMKLCDQVAGLAGVRHSAGRVVTAGMDRMTFNEPIEIGELLTLRAVGQRRLAHLDGGRRAGRGRAAGGRRRSRHTNSAYLTMVAVDADGRPRAVPPLLVEGDVEQRRERAAQTRRRNRLAEREEIVGG